MSFATEESGSLGEGSSVSRNVDSHRLSGDSSSLMTLDSYSEQELVSGVIPPDGSTSGSASSKTGPPDVPEQQEFPTEEEQCIYHMTERIPVDQYLVRDFSSASIFREICETSKEDVLVIPTSMKAYLCSKNKDLMTRIQGLCESGDFVYVSQRLMMTLKIPFPIRYPSSQICDVCIFSKARPVLILTIISEKQCLLKASIYNSQLAKAVIGETRKHVADFSVTHGVMFQEQFTSESTFRENVKRIITESSLGATGESLLMGEKKFKEAVGIFLTMICWCSHAKHNDKNDADLYFTQHLALLLCELLEEWRPVSVKVPNIESAIVILSEMISRFCSVAKSNIDVQCVNYHLPQVDHLQKYGKNVKVSHFETAEDQISPVTADIEFRLTSSCTKNARWDFIFTQDSPRGVRQMDSSAYEDVMRKEESDEELMKKEKAREIIASGILKHCEVKRTLTEDERKRLGDMICFSMTQFENRAATFLKDHLQDNQKIDEIEQLNVFMEDYLMQCFRQRNIRLTQGRELDSDSDKHIDSVRKLSPMLSADLNLERTKLLDRLIQHDVMSEAGRQSIMARVTPHSRNKAFITYLCGNFSSESFKGQFLPLLAEDHHLLAKRLEDEMDRLTISSKKRAKCPFCKMKDTVNIRRLADALYQMNEISESLQRDLSAAALPNTVKWSELFKHVKSMETIMRALELKNEHLYKEFLLQKQSCMECTCDRSEKLSAIAGSEGGKAEDDVANLDDFSD